MSSGLPAITGDIDHARAVYVFPEVLKPWRPTILAYSASFVSTVMGFPMDTVKTRMQTHKEFSSYWDCVRKTYSHEGIRGFYRGIWAPLVSTSLSKSLGVSIFTFFKPKTYQLLYGDSVGTHPLLRNIPVCFISGSMAGGGVSLFACPFEFTKVYSQILKLVQRQHLIDTHDPKKRLTKTPSTLQIIKIIIRNEGYMGLYSGYKYHFLRDSLSSGFYFSIYELGKHSLNKLFFDSPSHLSVLIAGGLSGVLSWTLIFPVDTAKALIQKEVVTKILRQQEGLDPLPKKQNKVLKFPKLERNMYRGLGISVTRSFLVNMIFFGVYEFSMAHIA
ncbi:uncharacterized protein KQ657_001043 [Scheffersomyces spartinae]|uniref:Mitochondrial thiamine pyrophosphate carrier 1 n=1 Tax=Scheffersomyces spartinae TaxID=45513 RepID=A0A9P7V913_9ASCO|nr:uncharacterized protein KQ657_001043 [Scheffersomyces spartinae]KAG7193280.1 hypothetical protein KQ657_001043 [Scheffersomyces spartinae]